MKKCILLSLVVFICLQSFAQNETNEKRKFRFPAWIIHSKNTDILGLSLGVLPKEVFKDTTLTRTYGIRIEAPGIGLIAPLMPNSPVSKDLDSFKSKMALKSIEKVYGINLSSGSFGTMEINGVSGALVMQYVYKLNGVAFAAMSNLLENHNGFALSVMGNEAYKSNGLLIALGNSTKLFNGIQFGAINSIKNKGIGLQIGLFNKAKNFRGIQFGLWNKNDKRSFPIINWQFKS